MGRYRYRPLPGGNFIRLATIHPGKWDEDIVISLSCVAFEPEIPPYYQALSYVWGSRKHLKTIYVGTSDRAKLRVTPNLKVALQHLRFVDKPRIMWVDAICINQFNNVEKGPQVAKMGDIFRQADMVIAWLGPERDDSNLAIEALGYLGSQIEVNWDTRIVTALEDSPQQDLSDPDAPLPLDSWELESISSLLSRRWFSRLWIRQEIYLAKSVLMLCGRYGVPFPEFRRALHCIWIRPRRLGMDALRPASMVQLRRQLVLLRGFLYHSTGVSLAKLRYSFQEADCQDPRDRIFAVRSLLVLKEQRICPPPNYTRAASEIYIDVTRQLIALYDDGLNILRQCELHGQLGGPSWVPDWSVKASIISWANSNDAHCRLVGWYETHSPGLLRVLGVRKAIIEEVQKMSNLPSPATLDTIQRAQAIRDLVRTLESFKTFPPKKALIQAYATALVYGQVSKGAVSSTSSSPTLVEITNIISKIVQEVDFSDDECIQGSPLDRFLLDFTHACDGRKLIRASDDYIGNAPPSAEEGDEVFMIVGCSAPMVLRRLGDRRFLVVGECYVDGLSNGEGLLGPLPDYIDVIRVPFEGKVFDWGFEDIRTGDMFYEDPRLKKLSVDLTEYRETLERNPTANLKVSPEMLLEHIPGLKLIDLV